MKMKLDMGQVALAVKWLQDSSDGIISVQINPYNIPKVEMTEIGFKWAFPDVYAGGRREVFRHDATYFCEEAAA